MTAKLSRVCRLPVFLLLMQGLAAATQITVTNVDTTRGGTIWFREDGTNIQNFAGVIFIRLNEGGTLFYRDTLCSDLFTEISTNQTYNTTLHSPLEFGGNMLRASWLVDNALLPTEGSYPSELSSSDWVRTWQQGAGIQLAIWDIIHDGGDGFNRGRVRAASGTHTTNATVLYWANRYETLSLGETSHLAYLYENLTLNGQPAQRLIGPMFEDGGPEPSPAPEPGTMILVGGALVGVSLIVKRRGSPVPRRQPGTPTPPPQPAELRAGEEA